MSQSSTPRFRWIRDLARKSDVLTQMPPDLAAAVALSKNVKGALLTLLLGLLIAADYGWILWENSLLPDAVTTTVASLSSSDPVPLVIEWNPALVSRVAIVNATWRGGNLAGHTGYWRAPPSECLWKAAAALAASADKRILSPETSRIAGDGGVLSSMAMSLCPAAPQDGILGAVDENAVGLAAELVQPIQGTPTRGSAVGLAGASQVIYQFSGRMYVGGTFSYSLPPPPGAPRSQSPQPVRNIISFGADEVIDSVGGGLWNADHAFPPLVAAMVGFRGALWVGGYFDTAQNVGLSNLAIWDGATWQTSPSGGLNGEVLALAVDASGSTLYAGGSFFTTGDGEVNCTMIAAFDGTSWRNLLPWDWATPGMDIPYVYTLLVWNDLLVAGGIFSYLDPEVATTNLAAWNGTSWAQVGGGVPGTSVTTLESFRSMLIVGGVFSTLGDGTTAINLAGWDGSAWRGFGGINKPVFALYADATRDILYVSGAFDASPAVSTPLVRIAQFDGDVLAPLASGLMGGESVGGTAVAPGIPNTSTLLYATGPFTHIAAGPATGLAAWDGVAWRPVGSSYDYWTPGTPRASSEWAVKLHVNRAGVAASSGAKPLVLSLADLISQPKADLGASVVTVLAAQNVSYRVPGGAFGTLVPLSVERASLGTSGPGGASSVFNWCNSTHLGFSGYGAQCCLPYVEVVGAAAFADALSSCLRSNGVGAGALLLPDVAGPAYISLLNASTGAVYASLLAPSASQLGIIFVDTAELFPTVTTASTAKTPLSLLGTALGISGLLITILGYVKTYLCNRITYRGCAKAAALARVAATADIFTALPADVAASIRATKSATGGALTLLLPITIAAYYWYLWSANSARPDSVITSVAVMDVVGPTRVILELNPSIFGPPGMPNRTIHVFNSSVSALQSVSGTWAVANSDWVADNACTAPQLWELPPITAGIPRLSFTLCPDATTGDSSRALDAFGVAIGVPPSSAALANTTAVQGLGIGVNGYISSLTWWRGAMWMWGRFTQAGPFAVTHVASWADGAWLPPVLSLDARTNIGVEWQGSLCFGGHFNAVNGVSAAKMACWDGSVVNAIPTGLEVDDFVQVAVVFNGTLCFAGTTATPAVFCWDGSTLSTSSSGLSGAIDAGLAVWRDTLCAASSAGAFQAPDGSWHYVGCWNASAESWFPVAPTTWLSDSVLAISSFEDRLVVSGRFAQGYDPQFGDYPLTDVAVLDESSNTWQALPSDTVAPGVATVVWPSALTVNGSLLYLGGVPGSISVPVRNGVGLYSFASGWGDIGGETVVVPSAALGTVQAMQLDGHGNLWCGGSFSTLDDGTPANGVAFRESDGRWTILGKQYDTMLPVPVAPADTWAIRVYAVRDGVPLSAQAMPFVLNVSDVLPVAGSGLAVRLFTLSVTEETSYAVPGGKYGSLAEVRRDAVQMHVTGAGGVTGAFDCLAGTLGFMGYGVQCCIPIPNGSMTAPVSAWQDCAAKLPPGALLLPSVTDGLFVATAASNSSSTSGSQVNNSALLQVGPSVDRVAVVYLMADSLLSSNTVASTRVSAFSLVGVAAGIAGTVTSVLLAVKRWGPGVWEKLAQRCGCRRCTCHSKRRPKLEDEKEPRAGVVTRLRGLLELVDILTYNPPPLADAIAKTRTTLGGALTFTIPLIVAAYAAYLLIENSNAPDVVTSTLRVLDGDSPISVRIVWNPEVVNVSAARSLYTSSRLLWQDGAFALDSVQTSALPTGTLPSPCLETAARASVAMSGMEENGAMTLPLCPSIIGNGAYEGGEEQDVFAFGAAVPLLHGAVNVTPQRAGVTGSFTNVACEFNGAFYIGSNMPLLDASPGISRFVLQADGIGQWEAVGGGLLCLGSPWLTEVWGLTVINNELHVCGSFTQAFQANGSVIDANNHAIWTGDTWRTLGGGIPNLGMLLTSAAELNGTLYVGGYTSQTGTNAPILQAWDGTAWYDPTGGNFWSSYDYAINSLAVWSGLLIIAGNLPDDGNALQFDGTSFTTLAGGVLPQGPLARVSALLVSDDGVLYMTGEDNGGVFTWDADNGWSIAAAGIDGVGASLGMYNGRVCVGGSFDYTFDRNAPVGELRSIACLDPATQQWAPLGQGLPDYSLLAAAYVNSIVQLGPWLVASGAFAGQSTPTSSAVNGIAAWDGSDWTPLGAAYDSFSFASPSASADGLSSERTFTTSVLNTWAAKVYALREDAGEPALPLVLNVSDILALPGPGLSVPIITTTVSLESRWDVQGGEFGRLALASRARLSLHAVGSGQMAGVFRGCTSSQRGFMGYAQGCCWEDPLAARRGSSRNGTSWSGTLPLPADMARCVGSLPPSSLFLPEPSGPLFLTSANGTAPWQLAPSVAGAGMFFLSSQSLYTRAVITSTRQSTLSLVGTAAGIISLVVSVMSLIKKYGPALMAAVCTRCHRCRLCCRSSEPSTATDPPPQTVRPASTMRVANPLAAVAVAVEAPPEIPPPKTEGSIEMGAVVIEDTATVHDWR